MKDQYAELLKRQEKQLEDLAGTRFDDIEKLRKMGRPYSEIKQVNDHYQKIGDDLRHTHEKQREQFIQKEQPKYKHPVTGQDITKEAYDKMQEFIDRQKKRQQEQNSDRNPGGIDR